MEKSYVIEGKMRQSFEWVRFKKTVVAPNAALAKEKALSILGGNHKLKRFQIRIDSVKEELVKAE